MYTISLFSVGTRLGTGQSGPTAGGVDIYYYLSGHIAPYCVAYLNAASIAIFGSELAFYIDEVRLLCVLQPKHCTCTHAPLNRTALGTEVCPTLVLGLRPACSPFPAYAHHRVL